MGLDMFLYVEEYVSKWHHQVAAVEDAQEKAAKTDSALPEDVENLLKVHRVYDTVERELGLTPSPDFPHMLVKVCVGYWRKANAIHNWFIEQCAENGVDDCSDIYVSKDHFEQLKRDVKVALDKAEMTKKIPTSGPIQPKDGFFFGATNDFNWYLRDLRETREMLARLPDRDYIYRASW